MSLLNLKRERTDKAKTLCSYVSEVAKSDDGWTDEKRAQFDALNAEVDGYDSQIADAQREERAGNLQESQERIKFEMEREASKGDAPTLEQRDNALRAQLCALNDPGRIRDEWRADADKLGVRLDASSFEIRLPKRSEEEIRQIIAGNLTYRATTPQATTSGAVGGNVVANDNRLMGSLEHALLAYGGQRNVSRVIRTDSGNPLPIPRLDDTTVSAAILAENSTVTVQSLVFGQLTLQAYKYASYVVSSWELLNESSIDLASEVGAAFGVRIGRGTNAHFTTGQSTASQPHGAVSAAVTGVTASGATRLTYARLVDLYHSVDPSYRAGPGFAVQMSDGLMGEVRALVDGNGQPLWQPSLTAGNPDMIMGARVNINQGMASSSTPATTKLIVAGDFNRHVIRDVASIRVKRLDERLALADQVGWTAFSSHDSNVTVSSTVAAASQPLKAITTT